MSWAETKYALNSTVGTEKFESLDKIFKGSWRFIATSDEYLTENVTYSGSSSDGYVLDNSFKCNVGGTLQVAVMVNIASATTYIFRILKNGVVASTTEKSGTGGESKVTTNVNFSKGDILTFDFQRKSGPAPISNISQISLSGYPIYAPELIESL